MAFVTKHPTMIQQVLKRDGRIVNFDGSRIEQAIACAFGAIGQKDENGIGRAIAIEIGQSDREQMSVSEIQVLVENALMEQHKDAARAYVEYRSTRDKARNSESNRIIADIIAAKKNDITRENANMNADTPAGMMMKVSSERTKEYVDDFLLSGDVKELVDANILHIHDKDYYPTKSLTCIQHPMDKVLGTGFRAGHGESRPAKRIETASIFVLHLDGNGAERDARWSGNPGLRFLSGPIR